MIFRVVAILAAVAIIGLSLWAFFASRRSVAAMEKDEIVRQRHALRLAGWREDPRTGRWSHPTKTTGELLMSEAEMVEATGKDWPEELRR
jgi:hypothetical protein